MLFLHINDKKKILIIASFIFFKITYSQSLTGTSGLISIPTADILSDGEISFGMNFMNKNNLEYTQGKYHATNYYVTVGYLPFLEISARITRFLNPPYAQSLGDRTPSVRIKFFNENKILPSLLIGAHDFLQITDATTDTHFNAFYIVSTKHLKINSFFENVGVHLGYGTDWMKATQRQFVGLFGGISFEHKKFIRGMIEYDAERFNCGAEVTLFNHIKILAGLMKFSDFSGGICYKTQLF